MSQSVIVMGMVLTAMPVNDYDKRITILTKERGKITAFARGSRRPSSQLLAATNPLPLANSKCLREEIPIMLPKQTSRTIFVNWFWIWMLHRLRSTLQNSRNIIVRKITMSGKCLLLYQSFRALENSRYSKELVRAVFELKAITINGEGPQVFACMHCHAKEDLCFFSVKRGGIFCRTCAKEVQGMYISDSTRYTMQYIISTPVARLYSFTVSEEVLKELKMIMKEYMAYYVHHDFKSLSIFG